MPDASHRASLGTQFYPKAHIVSRDGFSVVPLAARSGQTSAGGLGCAKKNVTRKTESGARPVRGSSRQAPGVERPQTRDYVCIATINRPVG
jgi:hypothetical protein